MVCGPEMAHCVNQFESNLPIYHKDNQKDHKHHEQTESQQGRFFIHLSNLIQVISEFGNPFLETSTDLLVLDTRNIAVACQIRNGNLDDFFRHENQSFPPSLSKNGDIRTGNKSDLIECLQAIS